MPNEAPRTKLVRKTAKIVLVGHQVRDQDHDLVLDRQRQRDHDEHQPEVRPHQAHRAPEGVGHRAVEQVDERADQGGSVATIRPGMTRNSAATAPSTTRITSASSSRIQGSVASTRLTGWASGCAPPRRPGARACRCRRSAPAWRRRRTTTPASDSSPRWSTAISVNQVLWNASRPKITRAGTMTRPGSSRAVRHAMDEQLEGVERVAGRDGDAGQAGLERS